MSHTSVNVYLFVASSIACFSAQLSSAFAEPNQPTFAELTIDAPNPGETGSIVLRFGWEGVSPGFGKNEAAEFEVHLNKRCFLMPPGGRDNNVDLAVHNLGASAYTDVGNYALPPLCSLSLPLEIVRACPGVPLTTATGTSAVICGEGADDDATFVVGMTDADSLMPQEQKQASTEYYYFSYPVVRVPGSDACDSSGASVQLQTMASTCTLPKLVNVPLLGLVPWAQAFDCPYFLGAPSGCLEAISKKPKWSSWGEHLCAPTAPFAFIESGMSFLHSCQGVMGDCPEATECESRECGPDPLCGESCGTCEGDRICSEGRCFLCGREGDPCCEQAACIQPGLHCSSGLCSLEAVHPTPAEAGEPDSVQQEPEGAPCAGDSCDSASDDSEMMDQILPVLGVVPNDPFVGETITLSCNLGTAGAGHTVAFFVASTSSIVFQVQVAANAEGTAMRSIALDPNWLNDLALGRTLSARCRDDSTVPMSESSWVNFCVAATCESASAECGPVESGCGGVLQCGNCNTSCVDGACTEPFLRVTFPNGGEQLSKGQEYDVSWSTNYSSSNVRVHIFRDGEIWETLGADELNDGHLSLNPPAFWPDGGGFEIRISTLDDLASDASDGTFQLVSCTPDCRALECGPDPVCGSLCGSCGTPPPNYCDGSTLIAYGPTGTCEDGLCAYVSMQTTCPNGCTSVGCVSAPEAACGNGEVEGGELCDPCTNFCDDEDPCTIDQVSGAECEPGCLNTPVTACVTDGCCPDDSCDAMNDADCEAQCGNGILEGDEDCATCPDDAPCATSGFTCISGQCEECGDIGEPCCSVGVSCFDGDCDEADQTCGPVGGDHFWATDFEEGAWPTTSGQILLPNGVQVWDAGGPFLVTEVGAGNPGQALAWYGGGIYYDYIAASIQLPVTLDTARSITLAFEAFLSSDGPGNIQVHIQRGGCEPIVAATIQRGTWRSISWDFAPCADGTGLVMFVGEIYEFPIDMIALRIDNITVDYR